MKRFTTGVICLALVVLSVPVFNTATTQAYSPDDVGACNPATFDNWFERITSVSGHDADLFEQYYTPDDSLILYRDGYTAVAAGDFNIAWVDNNGATPTWPSVDGLFYYHNADANDVSISYLANKSPSHALDGFGFSGGSYHNTGVDLQGSGGSAVSSPICIFKSINTTVFGDAGYTPPNAVVTPDLRPDVGYTIDGKKLTATYLKNLTEQPVPYMKWEVIDANGANSVIYTQYGDESPTKNNFLNYTFKTNGNYRLKVTPYTVVPQAPLPDNYKPLTINITIDGSSFYGSSIIDDCTDGECQKNPYEDCSTFGTDIIGGFGCQLRNFGVGLKAMFVSIFVPDFNFIGSMISGLYDSITEKLGFLAFPLTFVVELVQAMKIATPLQPSDCIATPSGTLFGTPVSFNFCQVSSVLGQTGVDLIRLIVQATTIFGLVFVLYREFLNMLGDKD